MSMLKPYWAYAKATFTVGLAYRLHILFWVLSDIVQVSVLLLIWTAIFNSSSSSTIQGYTLGQMMIYNLVIFMTGSFAFMRPLWDLADDHYDGKIAMSLIKPTKYLYEVLFRNLGNNFIGNLIISLPLVTVLVGVSLTMNTGVTYTISGVLLYGVSIVLALVISFFSNFLFATMIFLTDATFGMMQLNEAVIRIFSGSLIPLSFFPGWLRTIAEILPYASVYSVPTLILIGRLTGMDLWSALGLQVAWAVGLVVVTNLVWNRIIERLKVHGG